MTRFLAISDVPAPLTLVDPSNAIWPLISWTAPPPNNCNVPLMTKFPAKPEGVALPVTLVTEAVAFTQIGNGDDGVAHAQNMAAQKLQLVAFFKTIHQGVIGLQ